MTTQLATRLSADEIKGKGPTGWGPLVTDVRGIRSGDDLTLTARCGTEIPGRVESIAALTYGFRVYVDLR